MSNVPPVMPSDIKAIRHQQGFTLVEIIIALVVLSLISLGTLTAMRTLADTQAKLNVTVERVDEMRQVSRFLRNSLRQASEPPSESSGGGWGGAPISTALLRAEADELIWLSPLENVQALSGMTYTRLYRQEDTLRVQFMIWSGFQGEYHWDEAGEGDILVNQLDEFEIAYKRGPDRAWEPTLGGGVASVPYLVRLSIRAKGRYWPDIIVSPVQGVIQGEAQSG